MIEKIQDFWQTLDEKQQVYILAAAVIMVVLLLVLLLYFPLMIQNKTLNSQLKVQHQTHQKLINIQQMPDSFSKIDSTKVKSTMIKIAKQKGLNIRLSLDNGKFIMNAKNQAFKNLRNLLLSLRNKYAITTSKAIITRIKDGFVDAKLTLSIP